MRVVPLGDKVVIRPVQADERTSGGILLPESGREKSQQGRVLSVGDGRMLRDGGHAPHQVREGDRVLYQKYGGAEVEVNGEKLLIVSEDDILAVLA